MKAMLTVILTSFVVVFLVFLLNISTYNGALKIKAEPNLQNINNNDQK